MDSLPAPVLGVASPVVPLALRPPVRPVVADRIRPERPSRGAWAVVAPYIAIARPDHWFKNVFMVLGLVLAYFCHPELLTAGVWASITWAIATTCIIAS